MKKRCSILLTYFILAGLTSPSDTKAGREDTLCGAIKERFVFWLWSGAAPKPDPKRVAHLYNVETVSFTTGDAKSLKGYKLLARDESGQSVPPKGYLLMALGNAMIADQIIGYLDPFARQGYDIYIYDYRGYGKSEGKRRIKAIVADYKEIVSYLNDRYEKRLLYGVSFGGVVLLNVIGSGIEFDAAVIDSSPGRLSPYGCPQYLDPIENLPDDASRLMVITGDRDQVLNENMTGDLRRLAEKKGAHIIKGAGYAHPFMDASEEVHRERLGRVRDFLFGTASGAQ
ncbi:MAG: alpha/beta hydrolase [Proteobacteria bacterium]|nr:alpha/beta hydrolase [Pseudomonadota bacterium]